MFLECATSGLSLISSELVLGCLWGHGGCRLAGGWGGGGGGSGGGMALL